jgi:segregation and condensation protein B
MLEAARVKNILESLLFVARKPLTPGEMEAALGLPGEFLSSLLEELSLELRGRGIQIIKVAGGFLMGTNPENADYVEKILHPRLTTKLTPQALETLAIIAYKQPVTRAEVERLRGVISDGVIETLTAKKLIKEVGRSSALGRPFLYATTEEFMRHFGLRNLSDLPSLPSLTWQEPALR